MDKKKLENIEVTLAHQEQQINDLNEVITDQWQQIKQLNARLDKALGKIEKLENAEQGEGGVPVDRPPHWWFYKKKFCKLWMIFWL